MGENNGSNRTQPSVFYVLCFAVILTLATFAKAQEAKCTNADASDLCKLGGKPIDSSCRQFELEGTIVILSYKGSTLATIEVESKESLTSMKYERLVGIAGTLKALGPFLGEKAIGVVEPSGWTNRVTEYSKAYIVRREQTCSDAPEGCGIKKFTVFYWLPLAGRITSKRADEVSVNGFTKGVNYYVTINGSEVRVSESDYRQLKTEQVISLEATLGNDLARLVSRREM